MGNRVAELLGKSGNKFGGKSGFARKVGISRRYLYDIIEEKSVPSYAIMKSISEEFGESVDYVFFTNLVNHDKRAK